MESHCPDQGPMPLRCRALRRARQTADLVRRFARANPVFVFACAAAALSMLAVPPNAGYAAYIDWRTLGLLTAQLMIVQGLMHSGLFDRISAGILSRAATIRSLAATLVGLCFFLSMLVTNDVALISFVPLTLLALKRAQAKDLVIPLLVLETIAANLGSMFTPFGNPQNLYLFNLSGFSGGRFLALMAPYSGLSLILLALCLALIADRPIRLDGGGSQEAPSAGRRGEQAVCLALLILCMLAVFHVGSVSLLLALCVVAFLLIDRQVFLRVNYILPLTFAAFFILTGNIRALPGFSQALSLAIQGHELVTGVAVSQFISNVPAAMLLSSFTGDYQALIAGTNIGGLGTLIASMASLISFQFYNASLGAKPGKYLAVFTAVNAAFLAALLALAALLGAI